MTKSNMNNRPFALVLAAALATIAFTGCGPDRPKTLRVRGVVTLDDAPVVNAAVMFSPEAGGRPAMGKTDDQGRFDLMTFETGDGALPGRHAVSVTLKEVSGVTADPDGLSGEVAPGGIKVKWLVPERYSDPNTSGLTVDVERGMPQPVEVRLTASS